MLFLFFPLFLASCATTSSDRLIHKELTMHRKCAIHGIELTPEVQPIKYGLFSVRDGYYEEKEQHFSHYEPFITGGCVIDKNAPSTGTAQICSGCKTEYSQYRNRVK